LLTALMSFADTAVEISLCDCAHEGTCGTAMLSRVLVAKHSDHEMPASIKACPTLAELFGLGATGRSRLWVCYAGSVLLCLLRLYFPAQGIDLGVGGGYGRLQTRATGL
jgi:hypothetical protein